MPRLIPPRATELLVRGFPLYRSCCPLLIVLPCWGRCAAARNRGAQHRDQGFEAFKIVHWSELVDIGHHRPHAERFWLETLVAQQRVEPNQPSARAMQPIHLVSETGTGIAIEPVSDQENDGSLAQQAP